MSCHARPLLTPAEARHKAVATHWGLLRPRTPRQSLVLFSITTMHTTHTFGGDVRPHHDIPQLKLDVDGQLAGLSMSFASPSHKTRSVRDREGCTPIFATAPLTHASLQSPVQRGICKQTRGPNSRARQEHRSMEARPERGCPLYPHLIVPLPASNCTGTSWGRPGTGGQAWCTH